MPFQAVATRVLFYPTLLYNVLMEKFSSRKWYDRIDETVILGALPFRGMSNKLIKEENVRGVITMNEEYETRLLCHSSQVCNSHWLQELHQSHLANQEAEDTEPGSRPEMKMEATEGSDSAALEGIICRQWEALGVEQLRLSTVDFTGVPSLENLQKGVEFVHRHQEKGHSVYIHCKAGRSRSATMVAAYLIEKHKWGPDVATAFIANIRPHILIHSRQHQMLEKFYYSITNSESLGGGG